MNINDLMSPVNSCHRLMADVPRDISLFSGLKSSY